MPTEAQFNEWWLWAWSISLLTNGCIFFFQGEVIRRGHARAGTEPSRLGVALIWFFRIAAGKSASISLLAFLALWAYLQGKGGPAPPPSPIPFEVRTGARIVAILLPWALNAAGLIVVRAVRAEERREGRRRARGGR